MNVILIGEHTYGKNVGSFTITDNSKRWNYGLQPITFKILNALDQSDYGSVNGFLPDIRLVKWLSHAFMSMGYFRFFEYSYHESDRDNAIQSRGDRNNENDRCHWSKFPLAPMEYEGIPSDSAMRHATLLVE
jgi:hypothetical protein